MSDCKQGQCSYESIIAHVREGLADCEDNDNPTWSDDYLKKSILLALSLIVMDNRDEFTEMVDITLKNGTCLQSACDSGCEGIIKIPANVNGNCKEPNDNKTSTSKWLSKMYSPLCKSNKPDDYEIESTEILSDGGCHFKVNPAVPSTGTFILPVLCFKFPCLDDDLIDHRLCRHFAEIVLLTFAHAYYLEDDRETLGKSQYYWDVYFKVNETGDTTKRDAYVRDVKFGARLNADDES